MIPDIIWDHHRYYKYRRNKARRASADVKNTFGSIYLTNFWKSSESFSGTGSDLKQTDEIRKVLPKLIRDFKIETMLDIPCGDFYWMRKVDLRGVAYIGGDIVPDLITSNQSKYANADTQFRSLNLLEDHLPTVDLIFCRDCLVHFSFEHIQKALRRVVQSRSKYFLTTSFTKRRLNFDIDTGDWRPINLQISPFNLPEPMLVINEKCTEGNGKSYDKSLVLYRVSDLATILDDVQSS